MQTQLSRSGLRSASVKSACRRVQTVRQFSCVVRAEENGSKGTSPVDFEELTELMRLVDKTDIVELELKSKRFNMTVRKREAIAVPEPIIQMMQAPQYAPQQHFPQFAPPPPSAPAPAAAAPTPAPAAAAATTAPKPAATGGVELLSPMGGTFYRSPAPGEPFFCKAGDMVKKGQVVGLIEAMKLMNEIEAETTGEILAVYLDNGKPVSAGQPLFLIKP